MLNHVQLFVSPWTIAHWASLSLRVCSNSCSLSHWCYPTISSSVTPISSSIFPSIRVLSSKLASAAAAAAKSLQSCPTLCDPIDSSPPGSAVPGILQARTLEWVAIAFSKLVPTNPKFPIHSLPPLQAGALLLIDINVQEDLGCITASWTSLYDLGFMILSGDRELLSKTGWHNEEYTCISLGPHWTFMLYLCNLIAVTIWAWNY